MNLRANYILLDSARMDSEMATARELNPEHTCLYEGDSERFLGVVAPWLFAFEENTLFSTWIAENAQKNNWGIFFRSVEEPIKLYRHLRKFLIVSTEDGRELYFRFYDPRVLRVFLPTCDRDQLREFFGPIEAFIAEDENGLLVEYALSDEKLSFSDLGKEMSTYFKQTSEPLKIKKSQLSTDNKAPVQDKENLQEDSFNDVNAASSEAQKPSVEKSNNNPGWDFGY
jgi:hypothetical protein